MPYEPSPPLQRAQLEDVELEYEIGGAPDGEPVLLIHAGVLADWFVPLMTQPGLAERYQLIRYHRIGYAGSSRASGPVSIQEQASQARMLLEHLGIQRAHVVGHSSSADIALQLALDAPEVVASITLMEPARPDPPMAAQSSPQRLGPAFELFRSGDRAGAVDAFMRAVTGPDYRAVVEAVLPGAIAQAELDADTFFGVELPSLATWTFTEEDARRVTQPVFAIRGDESGPVFLERHELLLTWLPNAEPFVLARATHLLHLQNPDGFTHALSDFLGRHPLAS
jgi:pimeloyl-ACP methyl ester carboxylesterase